MKVNLTKGDGLTTPHSQPAKILTKYASDFIATLKEFTSGFYLNKSIDAGFILCCVVVLLQAAFMALAGVLQ